ncbi:MAG: AsmA family protein, partial [Desulfuromonadales bacterium]
VGAIIIVVLVLLVLALVLVVRFVLTPERIKEVVLPRAEAALNRPVSLGEVEVSLFSGITLRQIRVGEPAGEESFVAAEAAVLRYKLWPLLFKRVVIDEIRLVAPHIRVVRQVDGSFNFSDLLQPKETEQKAEQPAEQQDGAPIDLLVSQIALTDGQVQFIDYQLDAANPYRLALTGLELSARDISLLRDFPFEFAARLQEGVLGGEGSIDPGAAQGQIQLKIANVDLAIFAPYYQDKIPGQMKSLGLNLELNAEGGRESMRSQGQIVLAPVGLVLNREKGAPLAIGDATLSLNYAIAATAAAIDIEKATLSYSQIPVVIAGRVTDYTGAPEVNLLLTLPPLAVEQAIAQLPAELSKSLSELQPAGEVGGEFKLAGAVDKAKELLQAGELRFAPISILVNGERAALLGALRMDADSLHSENLQLQMGENRAEVDLKVENLFGEIPQVRSAVRAERFALDPLLQGTAAPGAAVSEPAGKEEPFPMAIPVQAEGSVSIGETLYKGLTIRDFDLGYRLQDNVLTIQRLNGHVAEGKFVATARVDLGKPAPVFSTKLDLQGIQANPLVSAFFPEAAGTVFGAMNLQASATGQGADAQALKKTVSADGKILLTDGRLTGAGLVQGLADLIDLEKLRVLSFSRSEGSFTARQGKILVDSTINGNDVRMSPKGSIGLENYQLDLALDLRVAPDLVGQLSKGKLIGMLVDEQGWGKVPVKVAGTVESPRFSLDTAALETTIKEKAGEEVRKKLHRELEKRLPSGADKPQTEPGRPGLEETLRGLFGN